jgi:DNA polymerase III delta prime subunit
VAVVVSATTERHSLLLETVTESEEAGGVMRGLLEVANEWGRTVELSGGGGDHAHPKALSKGDPAASAATGPGTTSSAEGGRQQEPATGRKHSGRRGPANNRKEGNRAGRSNLGAAQAPSTSSSANPSEENVAEQQQKKSESGGMGGTAAVSPRTAAATKLFCFATALEGLTMEEVAPPSDSDVVKRLNREEREYYHGLSKIDKDSAVTVSREVLNTADSECVPQRFRVLWSRLPHALKKRILLKLDKQNESLAAGDVVKFSTWLDCLLNVPLGQLVVPREETVDLKSLLRQAREHLDSVVYGHTNAKHAIVERLYHWLKHPLSPTRAIALHGPPGNGKTTLMAQGLAAIMNRPFCFISLGGAFDSSVLLGHSFTYEGSTPGRIVECLTSARCMNPILYFDELDKISESPKGDEICNVLIHLTDASQSHEFRDRYLQNVQLDMSKVLVVFSFNNPAKVNPILLDRLQLVETDEFDRAGQRAIIVDYLMPAVHTENGLAAGTVSLEDEAVGTLLAACDGARGVRTIRGHLERLVAKICMFLDTDDETLLFPMCAKQFKVRRAPETLVAEGAVTTPAEAGDPIENVGDAQVSAPASDVTDFHEVDVTTDTEGSGEPTHRSEASPPFHVGEADQNPKDGDDSGEKLRCDTNIQRVVTVVVRAGAISALTHEKKQNTWSHMYI